MSSSKRAGTPVRGSGMPGAGMHSKITFDEDAKANEKRDLTADIDEAARSSKKTEKPKTSHWIQHPGRANNLNKQGKMTTVDRKDRPQATKRIWKSSLKQRSHTQEACQ